MYRFWENVAKPAQKRTLTHDEKLQRNRAYDADKRARKFLPQWKVKHPWVRYDVESGCMFCTTCEKYAVPGKAKTTCSFIKGNDTHRFESIVIHAESTIHVQALEVEKNSSKPLEATPMGVGARQMNVLASKRLSHLFRTAHALAVNSRPFTDFTWHCKLDELKGVDIGNTYITDKKCKEFVDAIAEVERRKLEDSLKAAKFLSFMCDESTDSAIVEQVMIFVRYAVGGVIKTPFLAVESLETKRANAETIYNTLFDSFQSNMNMDKVSVAKKLIGMATDGASVLQGVRTGVAARMRVDQPAIQVVHCMAHRLELSLKDVVKNSNELKTVDKFLLNIYLFYHHSPTQRGLLKLSADALKKTHIVPTRVGGTRWVGHTEHALSNLWKGYDAIVQHCDQLQQADDMNTDAKDKARGFRGKLVSKPFLQWALFLHDITTILAMLSKTFQENAAALSHMPPALQRCIASLDRMKTQPGPMFRSIEGKDTYRGQPLTNGDRTFHGPSLVIRERILTELIQTLTTRYGDMESPVFTNARILDFRTWPLELKNKPGFGNESIQSLVDTYSEFLGEVQVEYNNIEQEWTSLKEKIYEDDDFKPVSSKPTSWELINKKFNTGGEYANILHLVDLLLTIPIHSAECERGFSRMKIIKTKLRNRLDSGSLTAVMRIQLGSAPVDSFDPLPAVYIWNNSSYRVRRPFQAPYGKRKVNPNQVLEIVDVHDESDEENLGEAHSDSDSVVILGQGSDSDDENDSDTAMAHLFDTDSDSQSEFDGFA